MNDLRHDPQTGSVLNHLAAGDWALRNGAPGTLPTRYTCTPWPESVDLRLERYEAELSRLAGRVAALEAENAALRGAP